MICAYCGQDKEYPNEFPSLIYAQCRECWERERQEDERETLKSLIKWILRIIFSPLLIAIIFFVLITQFIKWLLSE